MAVSKAGSPAAPANPGSALTSWAQMCAGQQPETSPRLVGDRGREDTGATVVDGHDALAVAAGGDGASAHSFCSSSAASAPGASSMTSRGHSTASAGSPARALGRGLRRRRRPSRPGSRPPAAHLAHPAGQPGELEAPEDLFDARRAAARSRSAPPARPDRRRAARRAPSSPAGARAGPRPRARRAEPRRSRGADLVETLVEGVHRPELLQQRRRGLLAHARDAGDVVGACRP